MRFDELSARVLVHDGGMSEGFTRPLHYPPYEVDLWSDDDLRLEEEIGLVTDLDLARRLWRAAAAKNPGRVVTLRQRARVIATTKRRDG